jgi:hypothetical protein
MDRERGVFELRTPEDLLGKLRFDLKRLESDPLDQYAAFDFFVSASHIPDWLTPGLDSAAKAKRTEMRDGELLLQVCDHIANDSKHFQALAARHESVSRTERRYGGFSREFSREFDISELTVHLQGTAAAQLGDSMDAVDLAKLVLQYWEQELPRRRATAT